MRVIKFRAWDGEQMHTACIIDGKAIKYGYHATCWAKDAQAGIPMQFTGLCDKNGKEIYEGDIMDYGHNRFKPIVFKDGCFQMEGIALTSLIPLYHVIGNIYEHPELLTNQK